MNRKDAIMVAVLANVCVVIIMFIAAVKYTPDDVLNPKPAAHEERETQTEVAEVSSQIEQILTTHVESPEPPPPPPPPPPRPQAPVQQQRAPEVAHNLSEVIVKQGDVLGEIAKRHGTTVGELKKINQLTSTQLSVGQKLLVPKEENVRYYTVKKNENPWTIAVKNNMKVEELLQLNGLDQAQAKRLRPGDQLKIK
ncbi:MAG: LysM peptidoglycan-binding domain-containing protein [Simkaniaceae bacterium]|nr:LysM peptidoglycan-binding domain-containing protein [Simkaniaceae bacterium]